MTASHRLGADDIVNLRSTIIECEQNVLGGVMLRPDLFGTVMGAIGEGRFIEPLHQAIWSAIGEASQLGLPTSPVTLGRRMPAQDVAGLTLPQYLGRLCAETTLIATAAEATVTWLRELWANHTLIVAMEEVRDAALRPDSRPRQSTGMLLEAVDRIRADLDRGQRRERGMIGAFAQEQEDRLRARLNGETDEKLLHTGLKDLDRTLGGFQRGGVTVIAGRPGMGKTTVAVEIARRLAMDGHRGAFFSIEMGAEQIMPRFWAAIMARDGTRERIEYTSILRREIDHGGLARLTSATDVLNSLPLYLDTVSAPTISEIQSRSRAAEEALGGPLDFEVIDYLGLVSASTRYQGQRTQEIGEVSRGTKALAKNSGAAIILLAQMNRTNEGRADKRPELSDLRDSGEIEQDAEAVVFAFREAYYLQNKPDPDSQARLLEVNRHLELIVAKNRHGPCGSVRTYCDIGTNEIDDIARY